MTNDKDAELVLRAKKKDPKALNELIRRHRPTLERNVRKYSFATVPTPAISGEAMKLMIGAVQGYNPKKKTQFKTYLDHSLRGLYRYTNANKGFIRIPEHRHLRINKFKQLRSLMRDAKGREPSAAEIADEMHIPISEVENLQRAVDSGAYAESSGFDLSTIPEQLQKLDESAEFIYFTLTPEEQLVYDYSLGAHGKKQIDSVKGIAQAAGLTADRVYDIKRRLAKKIAQASR